ncbi:MAG TPA: YqgE/AlgH family protein [Solirubrobacteraceae bacterium]
MDSVKGQLLIAGPTLVDPNFWRTVVLIVDHSDEGAFGMVLNRPSETSVGEAVPELETLVDPDEPLFFGGPVQPSSVITLAQFSDVTDAALPAFGDIGVLGTGGPPLQELAEGVIEARAYVGHSGWGPGQLDSELERGDWILEPARHGDVFSTASGELWSTVLTRKGGSYALVARMPLDPSLN